MGIASLSRPLFQFGTHIPIRFYKTLAVGSDKLVIKIFVTSRKL